MLNSNNINKLNNNKKRKFRNNNKGVNKNYY
jgi:hypothetical protein